MFMAALRVWVEWTTKKVRSQKYDVRSRKSEVRKYGPASKEAGFSFKSKLSATFLAVPLRLQKICVHLSNL
jgi:hypothetical protein